MATQKQEFEGLLLAKDKEIEQLKEQIPKEGAGSQEKLREQLERAGRLISIEREGRMRAEKELAAQRTG